jgi:ribosomal protein S18 acetylase RimI-like enzyme
LLSFRPAKSHPIAIARSSGRGGSGQRLSSLTVRCTASRDASAEAAVPDGATKTLKDAHTAMGKVPRFRQNGAEAFMNDQFGGALQARRGELIDVLALPGFVAERDGRRVGVVTYRRESNECELAFIAALERHEGVGTALLEALLEALAECERIWLVTTNDNLDALRFYQRRGFVLSALRPGAVADSRQRLKPQIASIGDFGIPLRDELELHLLTNRPAGP